MNSLDNALRDLAQSLADAAPPERVDRTIERAVAGRRHRAAVSPRRPERWLAWPLALAASIYAISFVVHRVAPADEAAGEDMPAAERAFLPVVSQASIEAAGDAYVVPALMPRPALAQLGLPVDPARADQSVAAELLVRPDGAVLAFRFVH